MDNLRDTVFREMTGGIFEKILENEYLLTALHECGEREAAKGTYPDFITGEDRFVMMTTNETEEIIPNLYMLDRISRMKEGIRDDLFILLRLGITPKDFESALLTYALSTKDPYKTLREEIRFISSRAKTIKESREITDTPPLSQVSFYGKSYGEYTQMKKLSKPELNRLEMMYKKKISRDQ